MHIREALLRLDQATKGMLECLLGPGGTLEALSVSFSRINSVHDAQAHLGYVRRRSGMSPAGMHDGFATAVSGDSGVVVDEVKHAGAGAARPVCSVGEQALATINEARQMTGTEILDLPEDGVEKAFEGGRDGIAEAVRMVQEMCCCLGEVSCSWLRLRYHSCCYSTVCIFSAAGNVGSFAVRRSLTMYDDRAVPCRCCRLLKVVSVEENHTRDLLRVLERWASKVICTATTPPL